MSEAWPNDTLYIKAGNYAEAVTFDKPMIIQPYDGPVVPQPMNMMDTTSRSTMPHAPCR